MSEYNAGWTCAHCGTFVGASQTHDCPMPWRGEVITGLANRITSDNEPAIELYSQLQQAEARIRELEDDRDEWKRTAVSRWEAGEQFARERDYEVSRRDEARAIAGELLAVAQMVPELLMYLRSEYVSCGRCSGRLAHGENEYHDDYCDLLEPLARQRPGVRRLIEYLD